MRIEVVIEVEKWIVLLSYEMQIYSLLVREYQN